MRMQVCMSLKANKAEQVAEANETLYFDGVGAPHPSLWRGQYNAVFIDPNKRNLLFCMGFDDTRENPEVSFPLPY